MSTHAAAAPEKPRLRGVSHKFAAVVAFVASAWLVAVAGSAQKARVAAVFGASLTCLLTTSALYHRVDWSERARMRMRRADHAAIFVLIAGGYTPLFALVPSPHGGHGALAVIWAGAALGVAKSLAWPRAPKWMTALLCVGLGWAVASEVLSRLSIVGPLCTGLLVACGVVYSLGAVVYALKRPDPLPRVFGYHEVFHALVIVASGLLFAHVVLVLRVS